MNDQTKSMMYFGFEPNLYIKINEFTFGVDKKMLSTYSDVFSTLLDDMDEDDHFLDLSSDSSIIPQAFNIVMMFYYTPSWCEFKFTNEHYKIIWQIVYICNKFNFSKMLNEIEKYLLENCNYYFETLKVASHYSLKNLRKRCLMFLASNYISEDKYEGIKEVAVEDLIVLIKYQNGILKPKNKN